MPGMSMSCATTTLATCADACSGSGVPFTRMAKVGTSGRLGSGLAMATRSTQLRDGHRPADCWPARIVQVVRFGDDAPQRRVAVDAGRDADHRVAAADDARRELRV